MLSWWWNFCRNFSILWYLFVFDPTWISKAFRTKISAISVCFWPKFRPFGSWIILEISFTSMIFKTWRFPIQPHRSSTSVLTRFMFEAGSKLVLNLEFLDFFNAAVCWKRDVISMKNLLVFFLQDFPSKFGQMWQKLAGKGNFTFWSTKKVEENF